ncbi:MAG TPA: MarR family transcriptional regulator [Anaerolineales bacterium]|nr:MarR family transcriptional regulator [Anaerolineales bacterium]HRQ91875.1 MarR family transcriptional regulator [Anaerolineales bacterium]
MRRPSLESEVCTALIRVGTRMAAGFDQRFAEFTLTQAQFRTLVGVIMLDRGEGITPSELADHLFVERATLSVVAQALVKRGLLVRRPGENRRSHRLSLTEAGTLMLQQTITPALELADETVKGLSKDILQNMLAVLNHLEAHLRLAQKKG